MRILLLTPIHREANEVAIDTKTGLPTNQVHNLWFKALQTLGHTIKVIAYTTHNPQLDYYTSLFKRSAEKVTRSTISNRTTFLLPLFKKQAEIVTAGRDFRPELVIISGNTDNLFPETILTLKNSYQSKLVLCNGLAPVIHATDLERRLAPHFDLIVTNDAYHSLDWQMLGCKKAVTLPISAVDTEVHFPKSCTTSEFNRFQCDISFYGSFHPLTDHNHRVAILTGLKDYNLKIFSPTRELLPDTLQPYYAGFVPRSHLNQLVASSNICLNLHSDSMLTGGNLRTFEIPACGGFQIIDRFDPRWFRIDKEIIAFKNLTDLRMKIDYYLSHPKARQRIAHASLKRVCKDHVYVQRFKTLISLLKK